jgi:hypothetical protein
MLWKCRGGIFRVSLPSFRSWIATLVGMILESQLAIGPSWSHYRLQNVSRRGAPSIRCPYIFLITYKRDSLLLLFARLSDSPRGSCKNGKCEGWGQLIWNFLLFRYRYRHVTCVPLPPKSNAAKHTHVKRRSSHIEYETRTNMRAKYDQNVKRIWYYVRHCWSDR